jgi:hypothetical protein
MRKLLVGANLVHLPQTDISVNRAFHRVHQMQIEYSVDMLESQRVAKLVSQRSSCRATHSADHNAFIANGGLSSEGWVVGEALNIIGLKASRIL